MSARSAGHLECIGGECTERGSDSFKLWILNSTLMCEITVREYTGILQICLENQLEIQVSRRNYNKVAHYS